jgi:hypothetical protein
LLRQQKHASKATDSSPCGSSSSSRGLPAASSASAEGDFSSCSALSVLSGVAMLLEQQWQVLADTAEVRPCRPTQTGAFRNDKQEVLCSYRYNRGQQGPFCFCYCPCCPWPLLLLLFCPSLAICCQGRGSASVHTPVLHNGHCCCCCCWLVLVQAAAAGDQCTEPESRWIASCQKGI